MAKPSTKHAVLGLMIEGGSYGYLLQQLVDDLLSCLDLAESAVYKILTRLEDLGWIEVVRELEGTSARGPKRIVYGVTPVGVDEFNRWMARPTAPAGVRDEFQAKLAVARASDLPQIRAAAEVDLKRCIEDFAALRQSAADLPLEGALAQAWPQTSRALARDYRARVLKARIDWLNYLCDVLDAFPARESSER